MIASPSPRASSTLPDDVCRSLAADPSNLDIEWNVENQLTRVLLDGNEVARFSYDALGRRVQKVVGGVTTNWVYDGADILKETTSAGVSYTYVHGPGIDEPLAREDGAGAREHYHADGLGSVIRVTNQAGVVVHSYRYDAWGNIEAGAERAGFAFTGREWEPAVGLYYYRARWYDAKGGRFISEDPIGFDAGVNFYRYVRNNPAGLRDPFGLIDCAMTPAGIICQGRELYPGDRERAVAHEKAHHLLGVTTGVVPGWRDEQIAFEVEARMLRQMIKDAKAQLCDASSFERKELEMHIRMMEMDLVTAEDIASNDEKAKIYWNNNNPTRTVPLRPVPRPAPPPAPRSTR